MIANGAMVGVDPKATTTGFLKRIKRVATISALKRVLKNPMEESLSASARSFFPSATDMRFADPMPNMRLIDLRMTVSGMMMPAAATAEAPIRPT